MLDALIFDFDGIICDTEWPEFEANRLMWLECGAVLTHQAWEHRVGATWASPWEELEAVVGPVSRAELTARQRLIHGELLAAQHALAGVTELMGEAAARRVPIAIASNSDVAWCDHHLRRLGLRHHVATIRAIDVVPQGKPAPDMYLLACQDVGAAPRRAVAFEDSNTGLSAAVAAGLHTVAIPHLLTNGHDLSAADLIVASMADVSLEMLALRFGL